MPNTTFILKDHHNNVDFKNNNWENTYRSIVSYIREDPDDGRLQEIIKWETLKIQFSHNESIENISNILNKKYKTTVYLA